MANNGSKQITRQVDNLREAASRARDLAETVSAVLEAATAKLYREGETPIDFRLLQEVVGRWIDDLNDGLSENQYQRQHLRSLNRHLREAVKIAAEEMRSVLVQVRFQLDITLGKKAASAYFEGRGKIGRLPPLVLERVSSKLVALYDDPKFGWAELPERQRVQHMDLRTLLNAALEKLSTAIENLRPEHSALVHADGNFQRIYGEGNGLLREVVDFLEAIYSVAGFRAEAASLAPSRIRRKAQEPEKGGTPPAAPPKAMSSATLAAETVASPATLVPRQSKSERRRERRARRQARKAGTRF